MKVIVDGRPVEVPAGTSAIDAVFAAGLDVPYFCSQPYLSPIGACRMCLVEAGTPRKDPATGDLIREANGDVKIFWFPKPQASCTLMASEGMVIVSQSESVKKAQAGMMEFTLINHPLDCPTCDKGGACELQDRAFEYGYGVSRFEFDRRHADKHYPLSELVVLDQERCIHCKRCVRYFEEIPGTEVLDFIERGGHTFIDTSEPELPTPFSGNITDICPVGALLDNVARFRGRNWEYAHTASTCSGCSVGCSYTTDARNGQLERIVARENPAVNETWICDAGRFGHTSIRDRIQTPYVRRNGQLQAASMAEAIQALSEGLKGRKLGIYAHSAHTLEEGIALKAFAEQQALSEIDYAPRFDVAIPAQATLTQLAQADFVLVLGADILNEAPVLHLRIQEMLKGGILPLSYAHGTAIADLHLTERKARDGQKLAMYRQNISAAETTMAAFSGAQDGFNVLRSLISGSAAYADVLSKLKTVQKGVLILGREVLSHGSAVLPLLEHLTARFALKVLPIAASANSTGFAALGLVGGNMAQPQADALLVSGLQDIGEFSGFLVVHDHQLSPLAQRADVVLPALSSYEKRGTLQNLEGRLSHLEAAPIHAGESVDLVGALGILAEALEVRAPIRGVRSAVREIKARFGVDVGELPAEGLIVHLPAQSAVITVPVVKSSAESKPSKAKDTGKHKQQAKSGHQVSQPTTQTMTLHAATATAYHLPKNSVLDAIPVQPTAVNQALGDLTHD